MGSIFVVFVSGVFLTVWMSAFDTAWPKVTIGALLRIAPLGALTGNRLRVIRSSSAEASAMKPELLRRLQDPSRKISWLTSFESVPYLKSSLQPCKDSRFATQRLYKLISSQSVRIHRDSRTSRPHVSDRLLL